MIELVLRNGKNEEYSFLSIYRMYEHIFAPSGSYRMRKERSNDQ